MAVHGRRYVNILSGIILNIINIRRPVSTNIVMIRHAVPGCIYAPFCLLSAAVRDLLRIPRAAAGIFCLYGCAAHCFCIFFTSSAVPAFILLPGILRCCRRTCFRCINTHLRTRRVPRNACGGQKRRRPFSAYPFLFHKCPPYFLPG